MDTWYQIKDEMTKQHKLYMLELKRIYEESKKGYQKSEANYEKVLDIVCSKIKEAELKLSDITNDTGATQKAFNKLTTEISDKERLLQKLKDVLRVENEGLTKRLKDIAEKEKYLEDKDRKSIEENIARKNELESVKNRVNESVTCQEKILASVKAEQDKNEKLILNMVIKKAELDKKEKEVNHLIDELHRQTKEFEKAKDDLAKREDVINERETSLNRKDEVLTRQGQDLNIINQKQKDKDIELQFRESEFKNLSDKVNQLIEIHKVKI